MWAGRYLTGKQRKLGDRLASEDVLLAFFRTIIISTGHLCCEDPLQQFTGNGEQPQITSASMHIIAHPHFN